MYPHFVCNADCQFCYLAENYPFFRKGLSLSLHNGKIIIDKCVQSGVGEIDILGGEPFLWENLVDFIYYAENKGIFVTVTTNGLFNGVKFVKDFENMKFVTVNFSIHSINPQVHDSLVKRKGALNKAINNLELFLEKGIKVAVGITVVNKNRKDVLDTIKKLYEKGVKTFSFRYFTPTGKAWFYYKGEFPIEDFWEIVEGAMKLKRCLPNLQIAGLGGFYFLSSKSPFPKTDYYKLRSIFCGAGNVKFDVLPDASIVPCVMFPPSYVLWAREENLLKKSILDIWDSKLMANFRLRQVPNQCVENKCPFLELCKGGCLAVTAWDIFKNNQIVTYKEIFSRPDPRCPLLLKKGLEKFEKGGILWEKKERKNR
ncbi:MAG: hypothetical protein DRP08_01815 [Candidatus Aenigmatarchaeota archaeon]|nr:MAG: hypothetical protein DRP08_01815 [Candidatus Aenigmarchaeota archaeon]